MTDAIRVEIIRSAAQVAASACAGVSGKAGTVKEAGMLAQEVYTAALTAGFETVAKMEKTT